MSLDPKLVEAKDLIKEATDGLNKCLDQKNVMDTIPGQYHGVITSIRDTIRGAIIGSTDDVRDMMGKTWNGQTLRARVQRMIAAAVEGKGGPDMPGPAIKQSSESARVVLHINSVKRAAQLVGAW